MQIVVRKKYLQLFYDLLNSQKTSEQMRLLSTAIDILETVEQLSTESETTSTKSE